MPNLTNRLATASSMSKNRNDYAGRTGVSQSSRCRIRRRSRGQHVVYQQDTLAVYTRIGQECTANIQSASGTGQTGLSSR